MAVGGAAYLVSKAIRHSRVLAFADLGMEAIYEFDVVDMPVTVAVDANGESVHDTGPREWQKRIGRIPVAVVCRIDRRTRQKWNLAMRKSASNDVLFWTVQDATNKTGAPPATGTIDSNVARTLSTSPGGAFSAAKTSSSRMNSIALTSTI
jgi:hypothetical protein